MESRREMGHPISSQRRWTSSAKTPGEEWVASGSNLSPQTGTRWTAFGYHSPAGGWVTSARRQKTWAPRRRTGPLSWSVGVSAHYLHLS